MCPPRKASPLVRRLLEAQALPAVTLAAETSIPASAPASRRVKLWELEGKHHCPLIGTCLSIDDLQRFGRRFKFAANLRDEFSLHVEAVGYSHSRNEVSEALQRYLDRKYQVHVTAFSRLKTDGEVRRRWQDCLARGEVAGALWASCTHKASSAETRQLVYGDIHMLSHQVGAGQAADARRLSFMEKENADLKHSQTLARGEFQAKIGELQRRNGSLESRVRAMESQLGQHEKACRRLAAFESGQVVVEMGQRLVALHEANNQLLSSAQRVWELEKTLKVAQDEMERFARERDAAVAEREVMERLLVALAPEEADCVRGGDCAGCPELVSRRCILYVGGRASMIAQYRQLADRLGVRLVHHDGGQEESLSRLPELILGADAVLCPTDQVSHAAYFQVKSHCKRVGTPCLFYQGTGVSSFAFAMTRVSRGEFSVAG